MSEQLAYGHADAGPVATRDDGVSALIAAHDWSRTSLGPMEHWSQNLASTVRLMLAAKAQIVLFWGVDYVAIYNDAYAPTIGAKHPYALGRPACDSWAELWEDLEPLLARVRRTGETVAASDRPFVIQRESHPEDVYFDISYSPVLDDVGRVEGVLCIVNETTRKVLAHRRLTFQLALGDRLRALSSPGEIMAAAAEMLGRHLGAGRAGYGEVDETGQWVTTEEDWTDGEMPSFAGRHRLEDFGAPIVAAFQRGRIVALNDVRSDARTVKSAAAFDAIGMRAGVAVPLLKEGGFVAAIYVHQSTPRHWTDDDIELVRDVGERTWEAVRRARSEFVLRESDSRRNAMVTQAPVGICEIALDGHLIEVNGRLCEMLGRSREELLGLHFTDLIHPADVPRSAPLFQQAIEEAATVTLDRRYMHANGAAIWATSASTRLLDERGGVRAVLDVTTDITERKRAEEHRELLINELNHRVKNTLATVQSIAAQTMRTAKNLSEARISFEERLMALSRAHDLLTREHWEAAPLKDVVEAALEPYRVHREGRIEFGGPQVNLDPRRALAMSMAFQELATNAVKYGALSNETGKVIVSWRVVEDLLGPNTLDLTWRETGGPDVAPPERRGFGSRLLERNLSIDLGGNVSLDFASDGLVCEVRTPLTG